ncbi:MAG: sigma-70 family RNA polymerase sigma factor [Planctomycetes bacterium]|nr:sigma-70 family RNA polymerase sigma factor [Planctomycetota bacterium]
MEPAPSDSTTWHAQAACRGEAASIEWIIRRLTPQLLSQARFHLRGLPDCDGVAEDLTQEVWAVAFLRLAGLEARDGRLTPVLSAFLARTMRHKALNWLRRRATGQRGRLVGPAGESQSASTLAVDTVDAIRRAIALEREDLLARALAALDEADREILILRGLEEHSYGDLADLLGIEAATLRMRYLRARRRLRERLPDSVFEELDPVD